MNAAYHDYAMCPHCFVADEDGESGNSDGCEKCNGTGSRVVSQIDYRQFGNAFEFYKDRIESVFSYWDLHINESKRSWSIDGFEIYWDGDVSINTSSYRGCGEYERDSFVLPTRYVVASNHGGDYKMMIDQEVKERNEKRAEIKAAKDAEAKSLREKESEAKAIKKLEDDKAEYERLKKRFG